MSAIIWLAIVAVWGFVLIPMWLRHHDSAVEQRSADRFSAAMRVLSRRGSQRGGMSPLTRAPSEGPAMGPQEATGMAHSRSGERPGGGLDGAASQPESRGLADSGVSAADGQAGADGSAVGPVSSAPETAQSRAAAPVPPAAGTSAPAPAGESDETGAYEEPGESPRLLGPRSGALHNVSAERAVRAVQAEHAGLVRLRRQRLLMLLVALPVSAILAATLGGMWIVVQIIMDVATAGYMLHLRRSAQVHRRLVRSRAALDRRIAADRAARARGGIRGWSGGGHGAPRSGTGGTSRGAEYEPVRLSSDGTDESLTAEDLAHARAETVDLSALVDRSQGAAASYDAGSAEEDADDDSAPHHDPLDHHDAAADGGYAIGTQHDGDIGYEEDTGYDESDHAAAGGYLAAGYAAADYADAAGYAEAGYGDAAGDGSGAVAVPQPEAGDPYTGETVLRTAYAEYGEHPGHGDHMGRVEYVEYVRADPVEYTAEADLVADHVAQAEYAAQAEYVEQAEYAAQAEYVEQAEYAAQAEYVEPAGPAAHAEQAGYAVQDHAGYAGQAGDVEQAAYYEYAAGAQSGAESGGNGTAPAATGGSTYRPGGAARPVPRPGARPNTSRPGRVQVHPPGTHGGLIQPAATEATATPAAETGKPAAQEQAPDELETLLRRHAVGS
ncbi:hypothetical protein CC117_18070 [Parafrankia colletiae]|uniref:Uncharacterized protein n=1 Tax=Parafrankia colletiae TaxID=573497 RepID=A0A1S1QRG4_9ACTN|nr:gephyrin-like molybdotransferase receptor GlpR [Parafrankia colletiae]MCK9901415.1 hypothetical protein [Frankia sp. Cpl3]OHV36297.1 hypothetical protein CC117_18070 [Parafrankia colletiae]